MKRIVYERFGEPAEVLKLEKIENPKPGRGEALLKVAMAPLHPADLAVIRGFYAAAGRLPGFPGFEAVGVVEAVGEGVEDVTVGQRCFTPRAQGAWAEKVLAPAGALAPLDETLDDSVACQLFSNPFTARLMLDSVKRDGAVVLTAAGSAVGRLADQMGRIEGRTMINVVRRRDTARDLLASGAKHVVVSEDEDWKDQVRAAAGQQPIVAIFDPVAGEAALDLLTLLSPGGELTLYGSLSGQPVPATAASLAMVGGSIRGFWLVPWMAATPPPEQKRRILDMASSFASGKIRIPIAEVFPLEDVREAVRAAETPGRLGKILLRP